MLTTSLQIPQPYASTVVKKILNASKTLAEFPRAGRKVPEFDDEDLRELVVYSYRVIYQIANGNVVIAAVIHGKRGIGA